MSKFLMIRRFGLLLKRDVTVRASYRTSVIFGAISAVTGLFAYAYLGNTAVASATSQDYGMTLAGFLISGVAFSSIVTNGLSMFFLHAGPAEIEEVLVT